jgi:hypothetical protein
LKHTFHTSAEKLRNPSLILLAIPFALLSFFLLLPVYPSRPSPPRRPPPCPCDLPRAPHFPPPPLTPISFCRVKDSKEIEKDLPTLPKEADEGTDGKECERLGKKPWRISAENAFV